MDPRDRECDGSTVCLDENGGHRGDVKRVFVNGIEFLYCDFAIERDRKHGFKVIVVPKDDAWIESPSHVIEFARILIGAGVIDSAEGTLAYFEKPWKWTPERIEWLKKGSPLEGMIFDG